MVSPTDSDLRCREARKLLELAEEYKGTPWRARFPVFGPDTDQVEFEFRVCLGAETGFKIGGWTIGDVLEHRVAYAPIGPYRAYLTRIFSEEEASRLASELWEMWIACGEPARILAEVPHSNE